MVLHNTNRAYRMWYKSRICISLDRLCPGSGKGLAGHKHSSVPHTQAFTNMQLKRDTACAQHTNTLLYPHMLCQIHLEIHSLVYIGDTQRYTTYTGSLLMHCLGRCWH